MAGRTGSWALLLWFLAGVCAADTGVRVGLATVETTDILRELRLTGTVTAQHDASLSVAAAGLVADIVVDTGAQVAAGDVLLRMDAELAQLRHAAAQAQVAQAEVRARDAQRRLQEAQSLLPQRSIAETTVRELVADRDAARATLQQVTAEASLAQALLARHTLRAPFAGVISLRRAERGEWLTPGQAVFDLVGLEDLRLDFAVPEDYLASLQEGAPMTFTTAARPAQEFTGT
ncbi:MAG TPA: efflux RND transporter periplasmic adaptor subunit, partial [Haliea salexigens]|nr:efflux RND transporter periplasmic adaptor subunit [Haliea salexigens]